MTLVGFNKPVQPRVAQLDVAFTWSTKACTCKVCPTKDPLLVTGNSARSFLSGVSNTNGGSILRFLMGDSLPRSVSSSASESNSHRYYLKRDESDVANKGADRLSGLHKIQCGPYSLDPLFRRTDKWLSC